MKEKFKQYYMRIAGETASLSYARRLQVGAIVVKDDRIISIGYNGMPAGWDNACEDHVYIDDMHVELKTKPEVLHAERNCLDKLAKGNEGGIGAVMFVTHSPCLECAKSIYGAGITEVFFLEKYRSDDGIDFLEKCGVKISQLSDNQ